MTSVLFSFQKVCSCPDVACHVTHLSNVYENWKRAKLFRHIQCWKIYNSIFWNVVLVVCLLCWALLKTFLFAKKYCYAGGTFAHHQVYSLNIIIGRKVLLACGKPTSCSSSHSKSLWPPLAHSLLSRISWSPAVKKVLPYLYWDSRVSNIAFQKNIGGWLSY